VQGGVLERHDLPLVADGLAREEALDDLEGILQQVEPLTRGRERDPELVVLLVEPRGAQGEVEPAVRGVVVSAWAAKTEGWR
jgi:hypothetical protein